MLKLNKRTEYALIALRYIAKKPCGEWASVHEIAQHHEIPVELLAKIMQKLKRADLLASVQGFGGGYALKRSPAELPFVEFLEMFEERVALTDCSPGRARSGDAAGCERSGSCELRTMLTALDRRLREELEKLSLADVLDIDGRSPLRPNRPEA